MSGRAAPGPQADLRSDTFLGCVPVCQYTPRLGALVLSPGTTEAGRVGGRGNRPGRGDANHASGLDEALPGLWTTEDRRVPSGGSESNWYEPGKKIAPHRLRIPDRWAMGSHPRRNFENPPARPERLGGFDGVGRRRPDFAVHCRDRSV